MADDIKDKYKVVRYNRFYYTILNIETNLFVRNYIDKDNESNYGYDRYGHPKFMLFSRKADAELTCESLNKGNFF